ncbi:hypothetical protein Ddye_025883 [Dipteronia dyeriana]|uniref:Uncharacterized protein n=1 Tax=Dipteronia dyeriana TaxID=168575 RepID=A0AAD9WPY4_9ROSI|nr:hypothetical protein Ddye_025883 [Dipteronia dyeriana]
MSCALYDQIQAAEELQMLPKIRSSHKPYFGELYNVIPQLINPLITLEIADTLTGLQENVITTMLNLTICVNNERVIVKHPSTIHLHANSLKAGTIKTRRNDTTTLFTISDLVSNRLCTATKNVGIVVSKGAIEVILKMIREEKVVDETWVLDVVSCMLISIKKSKCSAVLRDNCLSILYTICTKDLTLLEVIRDDETKEVTLSEMLKEDIVASKAKRTAKTILNMIDQP